IEDNYVEFINILEANALFFESGRYMEQYSLFSNKEECITERLIVNLIDPDSLVGWGCANVLKRHRFSSEIEAQLRMLYLASKDFICKWRIVHAMGKSSSMATALFLLDIIKAN